MFSKRAFLAILTCLLFSACEKHEAQQEHGPEPFEFKIREQGSEFKIPSKLWDLLLGGEAEGHGEAPKAAKGGGHGGGGEGGGEAADAPELTTASFLYAPIAVVLKEKNPDVLTRPLIRISLPEGGGEIDLGKWTTGKPGSFFVNFEFEGHEEGVIDSKVFFYSRARKRRVGDEIVGSGCRSFMDVSNLVGDPKNSDLLVVNTTRNFHTSVLGGHFLFSWKRDDNRKVTRVTFNDTAHPQYFCESEK